MVNLNMFEEGFVIMIYIMLVKFGKRLLDVFVIVLDGLGILLVDIYEVYVGYDYVLNWSVKVRVVYNMI